MSGPERIVFLEAKVNALTLLVSGLLGVMEVDREEGVTEQLEARITTWQERSASAASPPGQSAQQLALGLLSRVRKRPAPEPGSPVRACRG
jgi:hypothetical protein